VLCRKKYQVRRHWSTRGFGRRFGRPSTGIGATESDKRPTWEHTIRGDGSIYATEGTAP
jgi:hypothetical protein